MIIKAYGLFWRREEVLWHPGRGKRKKLAERFALLGRIGKNKPGRRIADFREQRGIYILYGDLGPHYVGLTQKRDLGKRLEEHTRDQHAPYWDRFSWFGFCGVLKRKDADGLNELKDMPTISLNDPSSVIKDLEAILIKAMALRNVADSNFSKAEKWKQVRRHEISWFFPEE